MTDLFDPKGHLTDEGLQALMQGQLDQLQSLEAAEHLAFCSHCMEEYLQCLSPDRLQEPPHDLALPVARGVRQKQKRALVRRYATAAAAAAISLTLWGVGAFQWLAPAQPEALAQPSQEQQMPWWAQNPQEPAQPGRTAADRVSDGLDAVFGTVSRVCTDLTQALVYQPRPQDPLTKTRGETSHEK